MATKPTNTKATVYVDVDDEITAIIDKVTAPKEKIVALVLPKRASVLQSVVNMKLLKRSADNAKKHVVLITTESGLLPLAGAVGMYVAPSLQSKPQIPSRDGATADVVDESEDFDPEAAGGKPVGELAGASAVMKDDMETIELDNGTDADDAAGAAAGVAAGTAAAGVAGKAAKVKKNNKLKVPDFNKFRMGLVLAALAGVGLLVFLYFAAFVLPKATITVATDSSDITTSANLTLSPAAKTLDIPNKVFPAKVETKKVTGMQQVQATGSKNKGTKATGSVKIINCSGGEDLKIPAGTGVSAEGKTFITQDPLTIPVESKTCKDIAGATSGVVDVTAISAGTSFNIGPQSNFTVAGSLKDSVKASSSAAMTGGTDNIVKVVSQGDIDSAKNKITAQNNAAATKVELQNNLEDAGYIAVKNSTQASDPAITPSAQVGDEADVVTVTAVTTYTMYGVKKTDIEQFIQENIKDKIDPSKQQVLDTGLSKATYDVPQPAASGNLGITFNATSTAGPDIRIDALKKQLAGKKTNDVRNLIKQTPGVTDVQVKYSPFWVSKVPKKESKIIIVIQKSNASSTKNNGNNP